MKAFMNLRHAVIERMGRRNVKPEQVRKIVEAVNAAAKAIDGVRESAPEALHRRAFSAV